MLWILNVDISCVDYLCLVPTARWCTVITNQTVLLRKWANVVYVNSDLVLLWCGIIYMHLLVPWMKHAFSVLEVLGLYVFWSVLGERGLLFVCLFLLTMAADDWAHIHWKEYFEILSWNKLVIGESADA